MSPVPSEPSVIVTPPRTFVDDVMVLLVKISVVALPTSVSVASGQVRVADPKAPVGGVSVIDPLVALVKANVPTTEPDTPSVVGPFIYAAPPIPTPPETVNAPVVVEDAAVVIGMET